MRGLSFVEPSRPDAAAGGVLILPGGGYRNHAQDYEGADPARWVAARGATAAVLRYRVAPNRYPAPLLDARDALAELRDRVPGPVAVWGFSAGAHLGGLLATDDGDRPDLAVLAYPVVSLINPDGHLMSRENLLGPDGDEAAFAALSVDLRVDASTPPTFLLHTGADTTVPAEQSLRLYGALRRAGVRVELHVFERGEHGLGLGSAGTGTALWPLLLERWMAGHGLFGRDQASGEPEGNV